MFRGRKYHRAVGDMPEQSHDYSVAVSADGVELLPRRCFHRFAPYYLEKRTVDKIQTDHCLTKPVEGHYRSMFVRDVAFLPFRTYKCRVIEVHCLNQEFTLHATQNLYQVLQRYENVALVDKNACYRCTYVSERKSLLQIGTDIFFNYFGITIPLGPSCSKTSYPDIILC